MRPRKRTSPRKNKRCPACLAAEEFSYLKPEGLKTFIDRFARVESRNQTGACARHQRFLTKEIKRARHFGLLPFTAE